MRIAICGKIGSGKSTVCEILRKDGFFVLSADKIYAELLKKDQKFVLDISREFGIQPIKENDEFYLDRIALARIIFLESEKRVKLNQLTHPRVMQEMMLQARGQKIAIMEVPLLSELDNPEQYFDRVIEVIRPQDKAISSVVKRDNLSAEEVKSRLNSQKDFVISGKIEHTFIYNDSSLEDLIVKVKALEKTF